MTIRIPPETVSDRLLRLLGKERQVVIPLAAVRACNELGPYVQVTARRENFFSALFRSCRRLEDGQGSALIAQRNRC